jgi:hypothetical protein
MIKIIEESKTPTVVDPSNNIFEQLGQNTYDYKDLLSELIDNPLAQRLTDSYLEIIIDIYVSDEGKAQKIVIKDNAKGIPPDLLGKAISPAALQSTDSLNEHGLGMKQAVASLGNLEYLATKTKDEKLARVIKQFSYGQLPTFLAEFDQDHGTEISIVNPKPIIIANPAIITRNLVPYLGARYRRFLRPDNKILNLKINIRDINRPENVRNNWIISEIKPVYFNPQKRTNEPSIYCHKLKGKNWEAELTFGYAPVDENEYIELGLQSPSKHDPYFVSIGRQGLDILYQNRVILFHQLSEIGLVNTRHNNYNTIRGEIDLRHGFSTAITKNAIIYNENFYECIDQVRNILIGKTGGPDGKKDYISVKRYPADIPEALLEERLAAWLKTNPTAPKKDIKTEYCVGGIEGNIDILADGEAWELKVNQASSYDVYQLFMYMDMGEINKGYLVASSFSTGATVAAEFIAKNHKKEIVLAAREQFPINHHLNEQEREKYL